MPRLHSRKFQENSLGEMFLKSPFFPQEKFLNVTFAILYDAFPQNFVPFSFQNGVRASVKISSSVAEKWHDSFANELHFATWYFLAEADQAIRFLPGVRIKRGFTPKSRSW